MHSEEVAQAVVDAGELVDRSCGAGVLALCRLVRSIENLTSLMLDVTAPECSKEDFQLAADLAIAVLRRQKARVCQNDRQAVSNVWAQITTYPAHMRAELLASLAVVACKPSRWGFALVEDKTDSVLSGEDAYTTTASDRRCEYVRMLGLAASWPIRLGSTDTPTATDEGAAAAAAIALPEVAVLHACSVLARIIAREPGTGYPRLADGRLLRLDSFVEIFHIEASKDAPWLTLAMAARCVLQMLCSA